MAPNWKPSRTARKKAEHATKAKRRAHEDSEKRKVRLRDKYCRFPQCGCGRLRHRLEVSHDQHKGMGGNPSGDRSLADIMVLLCVDRHQDSIVSIHRGTLRPVFLTDENFNGPIAWEVWSEPLDGPAEHTPHWIEVGRESTRGQWEPFTDEQAEILALLGDLED